MKPTLLYRTASGLLVVFALTHTIGLFRHRTGAMGEVLATMRMVRFEIMGFSRTFWELYAGFGLLLTVYLLFAAFLAWRLGDLNGTSAAWARALTWPFAVCQTAVAVLCWTNFFLAPAIVSSVIAVLLLLAAQQAGSAK